MRAGIFFGWVSKALPPAGRRPLAIAFGLLLSALLLPFTGCKKKEIETAEVSGTVFYKGDPLTGGRITFSPTKEGGFSNTADIDEKGKYKITAAIGEVKISVDNKMLERKSSSGPMLKRPGAQKPTEMKGKYVEIPDKYYTPEKTPLTYTVKPEAQTHDIKLD
jgi:hypothetical protein